jgi:hypothetical protein
MSLYEIHNADDQYKLNPFYRYVRTVKTIRGLQVHDAVNSNSMAVTDWMQRLRH